MEIADRVAVVTGAAGGIGGALVRGLAARGAAEVVAADLDRSGVDALAESVGFGGRVLAHELDVTDGDATRALVDEIEATVGPIDLWFANAGLAVGGGPEEPDEVWDRQWQVNLMAHVYATRALLPGWLARGEGHFVGTASMAGLLTTLGDGVYAATKHAAVGFAEWLAITYGERGVRVSCVCPGAVDTAMLRAGARGDPVRAAAAIGGGDVLAPDEAAERILDGVVEDRFLIYTHPEMRDYLVQKSEDTDRWIRGMRRLRARAEQLLGE
jgi:NAD(P)-dependent dehydrogenase (short-subunit alcohol dehydrogenase family)